MDRLLFVAPVSCSFLSLGLWLVSLLGDGRGGPMATALNGPFGKG